MKIGILTFHRAINYGAVLQCYGLYETIKSMGHDVEIIDYRPECIEYYRRILPIFKIKHSVGWNNKLKALAYSLVSVKTVVNANKRFNAFLKNYFRFSKSFSQPKRIPQDYDIIFFGSDQIWSPQICYGFDSVRFLKKPHFLTKKRC